MGARRWNHSDWTTITKWSVETWFSNEIDNLKKSRTTLPAIVVVDDIFCRLSSGSPSPSESARLGEWGKSMEEWESSGIKQQNRQTEIKLLINFKLVQTDAGKSDLKTFLTPTPLLHFGVHKGPPEELLLMAPCSKLRILFQPVHTFDWQWCVSV